MWFLLAIGVAAALATVAWGRRGSSGSELRLFVVILVVMQGLYLAFVLIQPSGRALGIEAGVLVVFLALAAGARRFVWLLPVGYLLHGLWDLRHGALVSSYVPSGYPELCVAYDWAVAIYLVTRLRAWWSGASADLSPRPGKAA